jgi:hypothetical protein
LGFPALEDFPNGEAVGIGRTLLLSDLGFFFSRLPLGMGTPFSPTESRQKTLDSIGAEVRSNMRTAAVVEGLHVQRNNKIMAASARYIVRKGKNGQYVVTRAPPNQGHRDVSGFATEAEANAWIASRPRKPER